MIKAILPVPCRTYNPGSVLHGEVVEDAWNNTNGVGTWRYGRDIRVPPLVFYRTYSEWKGYLIAHTFITDTTLNVLNEHISRNIYTGGVSRTPPVLVPISVKYAHPGLPTESYLFTRSIDFLLSNYRLGYPLAMCDTVRTEASRPIYMDSPDRITIGSYFGVCGIVEYLDTLLQILVNTELDTDFEHWQPEQLPYSIRKQVTPEAPTAVAGLLEELVAYEKNPDALFYMVDQMIGCSKKKDPRIGLVDEYLFHGQYDPVTVACLNTPTYLTLDALYPYLESPDLARCYYNNACYDVSLDEQSAYNSLSGKIHAMAVEDTSILRPLIDQLLHMPYTDVTVRIKYGSVPDTAVYDRFGIYNLPDRSVSADVDVDILVRLMGEFFFNWGVMGKKYNEVTLSMTWLNEVLITAINDIDIDKFYINLNLYHVVSPSLVNRERLESVIGLGGYSI